MSKTLNRFLRDLGNCLKITLCLIFTFKLKSQPSFTYPILRGTLTLRHAQAFGNSSLFYFDWYKSSWEGQIFWRSSVCRMMQQERKKLIWKVISDLNIISLKTKNCFSKVFFRSWSVIYRPDQLYVIFLISCLHTPHTELNICQKFHHRPSGSTENRVELDQLPDVIMLSKRGHAHYSHRAMRQARQANC